MMARSTATKPEPRRVGVNVRIPADVHRACKVACAASGLTWDQAVTEALSAWARARSAHTPK